jgi:hypothetical protein
LCVDSALRRVMIMMMMQGKERGHLISNTSPLSELTTTRTNGLSVVNVVMESVDVTFIKLQSLTALGSQQKKSLERLGRDLKRMCYAVRPIYDTTTSVNEVP